MEIEKSNLMELSPEEVSTVNGGVAFVIPPVVGFAAKVTGISLGMTVSAVVTALGLRSAHDAIFKK